MFSRRSLSLLGLITAATLAPSVCRAADDPAPVGPVTVHPTSIDIRHQRHPFALQVMGASADGYTLDLRDRAKFASADPKVAVVDERGWVRPTGTGATSVTVSVAGQTLTVPVKV